MKLDARAGSSRQGTCDHPKCGSRGAVQGALVLTARRFFECRDLLIQQGPARQGGPQAG